MEVTNTLALIQTVSSAIKELKSSYDLIAPIKNTLINPTQRKRIGDFHEKLENAEVKVDDLKRLIAFFGKFIRAYSELISDVRVAAASSDKFAELVDLQPDLLLKFRTFFINKMRDEYRRVAQNIPTLPKPQGTEDAKRVGKLDAVSNNLRDLHERLRNLESDDAIKLQDIVKNISTQYADMEAVLSEFLKEVLINFDPTEF